MCTKACVCVRESVLVQLCVKRFFVTFSCISLLAHTFRCCYCLWDFTCTQKLVTHTHRMEFIPSHLSKVLRRFWERFVWFFSSHFIAYCMLHFIAHSQCSPCLFACLGTLELKQMLNFIHSNRRKEDGGEEEIQFAIAACLSECVHWLKTLNIERIKLLGYKQSN